MRRKIAGTVGSVLLCVLLLAGCSDGASTADSIVGSSVSAQQESTAAIEATSQESIESKAEQKRTEELDESAGKFKSAENYQESEEYFKAYALYQKVTEDSSYYSEAQERAEEMLKLYWENQDKLIKQGEYQAALTNTVQAMNFTNMTEFSGNDENGLESTILTVAEEIAKSCGFNSPKASWDEIYTLYKFKINIDCSGINGKNLTSLSKSEIAKKYDELVAKYESIYKGIFVLTFNEIHSSGKWYSVKDGSLLVRSDSERAKAKQEAEQQAKQKEASASSTSNGTKKAEWATGGPGSSSTKKSAGKSFNQEYQNALTKGLSYARNLHMSKKAVYDQLTSSYGEGFPADAAQYAIDNMTGVDWNANALEKAKQYYYNMSMSKSAVYDQLTSEYGEQFTASQAQYAIDHLD